LWWHTPTFFVYWFVQLSNFFFKTPFGHAQCICKIAPSFGLWLSRQNNLSTCQDTQFYSGFVQFSQAYLSFSRHPRQIVNSIFESKKMFWSFFLLWLWPQLEFFSTYNFP
jgi:hypothetical protein